MIFRIIQHGRTHTILSFLAHEYFIVHTAFTACPESFILCKLGISNRFITQFAVDLHYGKAGSKTKNFCIRIFFSRKVKYFFLDGFCNAAFPECRCNNQTLSWLHIHHDSMFRYNKSQPICHLLVTAMTALPSSIFSAIYSGERLAIPVPLAFADDSISSVMVFA